MTGKERYSKMLQHPKWQEKRLEVMKRDGFKCIICGDDQHLLHVHHLKYIAMAKPWEYELDNFQTLCSECHAAVHSKTTARQFQHTTEVAGRLKKQTSSVACAFEKLSNLGYKSKKSPQGQRIVVFGRGVKVAYYPKSGTYRDETKNISYKAKGIDSCIRFILDNKEKRKAGNKSVAKTKGGKNISNNFNALLCGEKDDFMSVDREFFEKHRGASQYTRPITKYERSELFLSGERCDLGTVDVIVKKLQNGVRTRSFVMISETNKVLNNAIKKAKKKHDIEIVKHIKRMKIEFNENRQTIFPLDADSVRALING